MATMALVSDPARPVAPVVLDYLSFSGITTYANCPRRFYFIYVEHAPEEFVPAALAFGAAFHRAVETVHASKAAKCRTWKRCWAHSTPSVSSMTYQEAR